MRPQQLIPRETVEVMLSLYKADPEWVVVSGDQTQGRFDYTCRVDPHAKLTPTVKRLVNSLMTSGVDLLTAKSFAHWVGRGPKTFKPTPVQVEAMKQVEVNLHLRDYAQPFPALFVEFPVTPFVGVLCYHEAREDFPILVCQMLTPGNRDDVVTVVTNRISSVEEAISRFAENCRDVTAQAHEAARVAINCCLALANFGFKTEFAYPNEVARDRSLAREKSERGERARERVELAPQIVSFTQEVTLHRRERVRHDGPPTGREMPTHWRRGHWAMQPYGEKRLLRKRILRPPVLVRADAFSGDLSDTSVTYKG